ncbi:MAG: MGMT family protein [Nanobdellota archaeon]
MSFTYKVFRVISQIPAGEIMTYKEIARFAGNEKAYRAVGNIIHKNPDRKKFPCHRVVRTDLSLSEGYVFGGKKEQKRLLENEGIKFKKNKIQEK